MKFESFSCLLKDTMNSCILYGKDYINNLFLLNLITNIYMFAIIKIENYINNEIFQ